MINKGSFEMGSITHEQFANAIVSPVDLVHSVRFIILK